MDVIASWSGGKDSCLAGYKAVQQGNRITHLVNFIAEKTNRCCFHGLDRSLIEAQAGLMGVSLVQWPMPDDMEGYAREFVNAVKSLPGARAMVFGDIYLDEHKDWVERVCAQAGVTALEPIWNKPPRALMDEFVAEGFRAVIVSAKADLFGPDFLGREIDTAMLDDLEKRGICPCGEGGEFHTLVVGGPLFEGRIEIQEAAPVLKRGFWKHWSLDIKKFEVVSRN